MITLKDVSLAFKNNQVLDELSISANEGEIVGLVAPNGMGKTTLFNVIANHVKPDAGLVEFFGEDTYGSEKKELRIRKYLSVLPEQHDLFEQLSGVDHLKLYGNMWMETNKHIPQIIEDLNMGHYVKQKVYTYSLGMKQRLCFAMMLAANTPMMLMDEVMNGLDVSNVVLITDHLNRLREENKFIFIASHLLENLDLYADRVLFLKDGKIVYEQSLDNKDDLFLKVPLTPEQYEDVRMKYYFLPDECLYIADRILCIPLKDIKAEEQMEWVQHFLPYASQNITIGPLGTLERYERYYHDE